jgi:hypothetical protein
VNLCSERFISPLDRRGILFSKNIKEKKGEFEVQNVY